MNKGLQKWILLPILIMITSWGLLGQESVIDLLNKGSYDQIKIQLHEEIDLCIMDDTQINTKDEAIDRIKDFIKNNPIQKFENLHKGKSDASGSKYNVYKITSNNKSIRAFVYYENIDGKTTIKEIRFDKF